MLSESDNTVHIDLVPTICDLAVECESLRTQVHAHRAKADTYFDEIVRLRSWIEFLAPGHVALKGAPAPPDGGCC